jgi:hypothetical protein
MVRVLGSIIAVVALVVWLRAAAPLWQTQHKLLTYTPVAVTVVARLVPGSHEYPDRRARPQLIGEVEYHYQADGRPHMVRAPQGHHTDHEAMLVTAPRRNARIAELMPGGKPPPGGGLDALRQLEEANRLEGQDERQGYVNPADPRELFLPPVPSVRQLNAALVPLMFVLVGVMGLMLGEPLWHPWRARAKNGWSRVRQAHPLRKRLAMALAAAAAWNLPGAAVWAMYAAQAGPATAVRYVGMAMYFGAGLIPVWLAVRYVRLLSRLADARVFVPSAGVRWGVPFDVRIVLPVRRRTTVHRVRVGVICRRGRLTRRRGDYDTFGQWTELGEAVTVPAGETWEAVLEGLQILDEGPSSSARGWQAGALAWRIALEAHLDGAPTYRADFPITVVEGELS